MIPLYFNEWWNFVVTVEPATESSTVEGEQLTLDGFFWSFLLLGSLFTSLGIVSLVLKTANIGVAPVLQEVVEYYRNWVHPPMEWLLGWIKYWLPSIELPAWAADAYMLSFAGAFALGRSVAMAYRGSAFSRGLLTLAIGSLAGASLLGLIVLLIAVVNGLSSFFRSYIKSLLSVTLSLAGKSSEIDDNYMRSLSLSSFWLTLLILVFLFYMLDPTSVITKVLIGVYVCALLLTPLMIWSVLRRTRDFSLMGRLQFMIPVSVLGAVLFFAINSQL